MVISEQDNSVEILCVEVLPAHSQCAGDMRLHVRIVSHGFTGERVGIWVDAPAFRSFLDQLRALDLRRQGAAEVEAMSPEEFRLRLRAVDRAGHMVVEGRLAHWVPAFSSRTPLLHSIEFGFEFCPSLLPVLITQFESLPKAQS